MIDHENLRSIIRNTCSLQPEACSSFNNNTYICGMLTREEENFIVFWEKNRMQQKHSTRPFMIGLSAGFVFGIGVIAVLYTGWYERANMVANARLSSFVFLLAILGISFFMAFVYRKFRWESREQQYRELLAKKKASQKNNL